MSQNNEDLGKSPQSAIWAFESDKNEHLARLTGERGKALIERWTPVFFDRQTAHPNVEEFRFHLEAAVEDYVGFFIASDERAYDEAERARIRDIAKRFHEMFYEGQVDPHAPETPDRQDAVIRRVWAKSRIVRLLDWVAE